MKRPKHYHPEPGDEFIKLEDLRPEHKGRVFEARDQKTGEGVIGSLQDANHYLLEGVVGIRFVGTVEGIFSTPDALILLKSPDYVMPS